MIFCFKKKKFSKKKNRERYSHVEVNAWWSSSNDLLESWNLIWIEVGVGKFPLSFSRI